MKNGKVSGEIPDDKCYSLASYFTSGMLQNSNKIQLHLLTICFTNMIPVMIISNTPNMIIERKTLN